jgi:hypothetical protein
LKSKATSQKLALCIYHDFNLKTKSRWAVLINKTGNYSTDILSVRKINQTTNSKSVDTFQVPIAANLLPLISKKSSSRI